MARSLAALGAASSGASSGAAASSLSVTVEVTQTWTLTLESSSGADAAALVAEVLATCEAASPGCTVTLVGIPAARRALRAASGGRGGSNKGCEACKPGSSGDSDSGSSHHRLLSGSVQVQVERQVTGSTLSTAAVPLPTTVTATSSSLDTLSAQMSVLQLGGAAEAQALSDSLTTDNVAGQISADLGLNATQLVVAVSNPIYPPHPPPALPPRPPSAPPPSPSSPISRRGDAPQRPPPPPPPLGLSPQPPPPLVATEGGERNDTAAGIGTDEDISAPVAVAGSVGGLLLLVAVAWMLRRSHRKHLKVSPHDAAHDGSTTRHNCRGRFSHSRRHSDSDSASTFAAKDEAGKAGEVAEATAGGAATSNAVKAGPSGACAARAPRAAEQAATPLPGAPPSPLLTGHAAIVTGGGAEAAAMGGRFIMHLPALAPPGGVWDTEHAPGKLALPPIGTAGGGAPSTSAAAALGALSALPPISEATSGRKMPPLPLLATRPTHHRKPPPIPSYPPETDVKLGEALLTASHLHNQPLGQL